MQKPTQILIGYVHPGKVETCFMESVLNLHRQKFPERRISWGLAGVQSGPLLSKARNMLVETFLQETQAEYLLMCDTDMHFAPKDVLALLKADKPIVGALYFGLDLSNYSSFPVALNFVEDAYRPVKEIPESGCVEVDAVGMGLTLIKRKVLQDLGADHHILWPFAETVVDGRALGEDLTFCLRAKEKGYQTWLCGDARAGHAKTIMIGANTGQRP